MKYLCVSVNKNVCVGCKRMIRLMKRLNVLCKADGVSSLSPSV